MPRHARSAPGGYVYHALNRAVARLPLFQKDEDYRAFERVLVEAMHKHATRILAYCLMPNHWHFVLWPRRDEELTAFLRWLTHTHTQRWHAHYHTAGSGHLYQGRFKAFPIEENNHLYSVLRYVERNALRANLVKRAEAWRWSSLAHRLGGDADPIRRLLHAWPVPMPRDWLARVNRAQSQAELEALRRSLTRGQPFGSESWQARTTKKLGLEYTLRRQGRPRKKEP
ncbi:MAG: transposase [Planctomycetes bacterium]|nr:transposase [Planctomycetota bacterium]